MRPFRRPLLPCLLAYVLGLWLIRDLRPAGEDLLVFFGFTGAGAAAAWSLWRRETTPLFLALFVVCGAVRMHGIAEERTRAESVLLQLDDGIPRPLEGTVVSVVDDVAHHRMRLTLEEVKVTSGSEVHFLPGRVDVVRTLRRAGRAGNAGGAEPDERAARDTFEPGTRVRTLAALSEPRTVWNFHGFNNREYLAQRRIYAYARVFPGKRFQEVEGESRPLRRKLVSVRSRVRSVLQNSMPPHEALLNEVLFFNDLRLLSDEDERIFRDSGTMHLFAVSGTHIALLSLVIVALLRTLRLSDRTAWTVAAVLLFAYVCLLDFVAPALRAFLMLVAFVSGKWLRREVDPLSSLTFGAFIILLVEPQAAWQAGFHLSLMGVVAIVVFVPLGRHWFTEALDPGSPARRAARCLVDGALVTGGVTLVLLPLQLFYFQQFNVLSPLANLLEGMLAMGVLASGLAAIGVGLALPVVAAPFGAASAMLMRLSWAIAAYTSDREWALLKTGQPPVWSVLLFYGILFSGWYMVRRHTPEFRPKSLARFTIHALLAVLVLVAAVEQNRFSRKLRIWFLDVGQGDSTLVQFPSGQTMLVDAGHFAPDYGRMVVGPQLRGLAVRRLDELVATHADADHIGGIPWLLQNHPVGRLVEGTNRPAEDERQRLVDEACSASAVERLQVLSGPEMRLDERTSVEILNPIPELAHGGSDNDQSIVLRIRHGRFTALLMADAELAVEERLVARGIGRCDVLKVGHHGSRTSSSPGFLRAVRPQAAVISCGRRNRYGHPHPDVLAGLEEVGSAIYRTDRDGAVLVESDGETWSVQVARPRW